jgi:hypothetical protein
LTLARTLKIQALPYIRVRKDKFIYKVYIKRRRRRKRKKEEKKVVHLDPYDP